MVVVSTKQFRNSQKKYFDLAREEKVLIKRGDNYVHLIVTSKPDDSFVTDQWVAEFLSIPEEYRCNPFEISPSGDLFWADKRNVESFQRHADISEQQYKEGEYTECKTWEESKQFLNSL